MPDEVEKGVVDILELPVGVDHVDGVAKRPQHRRIPLGGAPRPVLLNGVVDAVGQPLVLVGPALLEVAGDAGVECLACDFLAALPGEKHKGQFRVALVDSRVKLQAVHRRHLVVADDTVDFVVESL